MNNSPHLRARLRALPRLAASTLTLLAVVALAVAVAVTVAPRASAQEPESRPSEPRPPDSRPTAVRPFLWRIERDPPCWLYGTIHVPDRRVTDLPAVVEDAVEHSDVVLTEVRMDELSGALKHMMLGPRQSLKDLLPAATWERLTAYCKAKRIDSAVLRQLERMKPWAALMTLVQLEFMKEVQAGGQALDQVIWSDARAAGKELDALEALGEQLGVFESFTAEEQVELIAGTLDLLEKLMRERRDYRVEIIDLYLEGDEERLMDKMDEYSGVAENQQLEARFKKLLLDDRNERMVARMVEKMQAAPDKAFFFAVGAAHYPKEKGILALLRAQGFAVTRVEPGVPPRKM